MPTCSVPYCTNVSGKNSRLTFHEFPHETPLFFNKWLENIGRPNWRPGRRSVICSEHFLKDDFDRRGRLHIGSFPSKFPKPPFRKKKKLKSGEDSAQSLKTDSPALSADTAQSRKTDALPLGSSNYFQKLKAALKSSLKSGDSGPETESTEKQSSLEQESSLLVTTEHSAEPSLDLYVLNDKSICEISDSEWRGYGEELIEFFLIDDLSNHTINMASSIIGDSPESGELMNRRKAMEESLRTSSCGGSLAAVASSFSLLSCRVCGLTDKSNVKIFGPEGQKLGLADMMHKCLPIKVSESDSLPQSVCTLCISRIKVCSELVEICEKTNSIFHGRTSNSKDSDPPVILSKPVHTKRADKTNRRVLLLEMTLREGVPVKNMITQALKELNLRLKPKESRESKPEGRIMFLDLHGGPDAFPEQMKKAMTMLFPCKQEDVTATDNSKTKLKRKADTTPLLASSKATSTVTTSGPSISLPASQIVAPTVTISSTVPSKVIVTSTPSGKVIVSSTASPVPLNTLNVSGVASSSLTPPPPLMLQPIAPRMPSVPQNIMVPVSFMQRLPSSMIRLPAGVLPQLVHVPSNNLIKIEPMKATAKNPVVAPSFERKSPDSSSSNVVEESIPVECVLDSNSQDADSSMPPLVAINENPDKSKESSSALISSNDLSKMKEKLITKIQNQGHQLKLGDKIVGIVLRNSDSREDIHKKLQATFSNVSPVPSSSKTAQINVKSTVEKGSVTILPSESNDNQPMDLEDGRKKVKEKVLDAPAAVDEPSAFFERRNIRKLSLNFVWRKNGFLVSSYQKLFTWQLNPDCSENQDSNPVLTCRVCKYVTKSKGDVQSHLQAHPDLQCTVCWKYFLTVGKVQEHMGVIHNMVPLSEIPKRKPFIQWRHTGSKRMHFRQFQCSGCERRFKLRDSLRKHIVVCKDRSYAEKVVAISKGQLLICSVCKRSFSTPDALDEHLLSHTKRTSWLCDICGLVLKSASNYRTHVGRHDELAHEYNYQCTVCKKRFKLSHRYEEHIKKHDVQTQFICSSCGKVFQTLNGLRQHEILHGERKLQCRFCPSRFHRRDHLRIHEATHSKKSHPVREGDTSTSKGGPRSYSCRFCLANENTVIKFSSMRDLMRHYNESHSAERKGLIPGGKKYQCDRCHRAFANSTLLRHHIMWHAGIHPYTCSHCGAGFMVKERLRNHEALHTNERPFKCQICGKGFRSRNCLKQHKVIHKDPSEFYKCKYCEKTFSRIDNLRTHTRVHTGEKPWKCLHCERQFRLRSEGTKHVQLAHQIPASEVLDHLETLVDPNSLDMAEESNSAESVLESAIAGITTVQDMSLLIEPDDMDVSGL